MPPPEALKSLADIVLPTDGILFPAWASEASLVLLDGFQIRNPVQSVSTLTYEKCGYSTQRMYFVINCCVKLSKRKPTCGRQEHFTRMLLSRSCLSEKVSSVNRSLTDANVPHVPYLTVAKPELTEL